jgi:hypothetical protein
MRVERRDEALGFVDSDESPATPAIMVALVLLCVAPIVLFVIGSDTLAARL